MNVGELQKGAGDPARKSSKAVRLRTAAQDHCDLALETLVSIMKGQGQDTVKLAAAREMLDRAHGKPKPPSKAKARAPAKRADKLTVIVKKFTDITPEEEAAAEATERGEL